MYEYDWLNTKFVHLLIFLCELLWQYLVVLFSGSHVKLSFKIQCAMTFLYFPSISLVKCKMFWSLLLKLFAYGVLIKEECIPNFEHSVLSFRYRTPIVCHSNIFAFGFSRTIYERDILWWLFKTKHQHCSFTFSGLLSPFISGSFLLIHCSDFAGSNYIFWTITRDRRRHEELQWYSNGYGRSGNKCYNLCSPKTRYIWKKYLF